MEKGTGIYKIAHLQCPHSTSLAEYYNQAIKNSSRLYPNRQSYVTHRMINDVAGKGIRKEWNDSKMEMRQHMQTKVEVGKQNNWALRQQALDLQCRNGCF